LPVSWDIRRVCVRCVGRFTRGRTHAALAIRGLLVRTVRVAMCRVGMAMTRRNVPMTAMRVPNMAVAGSADCPENRKERRRKSAAHQAGQVYRVHGNLSLGRLLHTVPAT
jgi:hypothetical protein